MSDTTQHTGTTVTLTWSPEGGEVVRQVFTGMTPDDIVAATAALAARRMSVPQELYDADMKQLKAARNRQMSWYADRITKALYDGLGRWFKVIPLRVRVKTVQLLMDYLRDITAVWLDETIAAREETRRTHEQAQVLRLRPRSAPENGPRILCKGNTDCKASALLAADLPDGWSTDGEGHPHCPQHPASVAKAKERVG
jgi:hypothetical protein